MVVGASAGGVEALRQLVAALPKDLPAAVVVVLHMPAGGSSALAAILARSGPLPTATVQDGTELRNARIHVARPDHHVVVQDGVLRLSGGPPRTATGRPSTRCSAPPHSRGVPR
ncbi:chemotaxis protein CheB [Lentzea rhizosphaerae]|uniref:protein-glutamate methylesterase n=1 Tax=Lentzea rhizosphaerae TaxID=2041025 RepID=A0ABV8C448_9PSEU